MQPTIKQARQFLCWVSTRTNVPLRQTAEVMHMSKTTVSREAARGKLVADHFLNVLKRQMIPRRVNVKNIENFPKERDMFY